MTESFPLKWPDGKVRTKDYTRREAPFRTTLGRARDELTAELNRLNASHVVISSNVATYMRGGREIMYDDQTAAKQDPGVAVYYTWKGDQYLLACDAFKTVIDNLQALNKTVNAIRGIERWGTGEMMKAAFAGFKTLPAQSQAVSCWIVLGIEPTKSEDLIKAAYRSKAKLAHPDMGGSDAAMQQLNEAYADALK